MAGAVPTIWNGLLQHVRAHGGDLVVAADGALRRLGRAARRCMEAYEKELGVRIVQAWGMTETSPLGSVAHPPAGTPGDEAWRYRDTAGRLVCAVEARLVGDGGAVLPHDGKAVGEIEVRGPWVTGAYYKDDDPAKFRDGWLRTGDVGHHRPARLRDAHRPGQGRDQVRRRVDLVDGAGERASWPTRRWPRRR